MAVLVGFTIKSYVTFINIITMTQMNVNAKSKYGV